MSKLPAVENLDDIIAGVEVISSNCDSFFSAVIAGQQMQNIDNKAISYDVHQQFKVSEMMYSIYLNEERKRYFEVPLSTDGDIISHIDIGGGSTCNGKLKISCWTKQSDCNRRIVLCASIYSPVSLVVVLDDDHDMDSTIFLSWKVTVFLDARIRKRVMYANLLCEGIRYLNGVITEY